MSAQSDRRPAAAKTVLAQAFPSDKAEIAHPNARFLPYQSERQAAKMHFVFCVFFGYTPLKKKNTHLPSGILSLLARSLSGDRKPLPQRSTALSQPYPDNPRPLLSPRQPIGVNRHLFYRYRFSRRFRMLIGMRYNATIKGDASIKLTIDN